MRLVCFVKDWLKKNPDMESTFLAETGIKPRMLDNLRRDDVNWRLERDQIEAMMLFGYRHSIPEIFSIQHHPLWATFDSSPALLFRGAPRWDAKIEEELSGFLEHMGGSPRSVTNPPTVAGIEKAMKEANCIFVGSPKSNPATEIAICLLAGARPFDPKKSNRDNLPVQMLVAEPPPEPSAVLFVDHPYGFSVRGKRGKREHIGAHWLSPKEYESWHGEAEDSAVVIIRRSPLDTEEPVTTIIVMGYSGLATQTAMFELMKGADLPLKESQLESRKTQILAYHFQFEKPKRITKSRRDPRRVIPETGTWWPPAPR
ncbi:MAG TPA: hypothetical protein VF057_05290 [Thermoanaerobaculia bacterium]